MDGIFRLVALGRVVISARFVHPNGNGRVLNKGVGLPVPVEVGGVEPELEVGKRCGGKGLSPCGLRLMYYAVGEGHFTVARSYQPVP